MDCGKYEYRNWGSKENFLKVLYIYESGVSNNGLRGKILHSRAKNEGGSFEIFRERLS